MKAVGYQKSLPIEDKDALVDFETAKPEPKGRDIRVAVKAISANPVDYKVRKRAAPPAGEFKILGFDAAGVVDAVGPEVSLFKPGDEVLVHDAPTHVEFGERVVVRRTATVFRGGPLDRLRARIEGYLELTELYEVSFSDGRAS